MVSPSNAPGNGRPEVIIVGAGPVGLSLALGLACHRVRSILVEKKEGTSRSSKAPVIHARTLETLRPWGVAQRLLREGRLAQSLTLHSAVPGSRPYLTLDFRELDETVDGPGLLILEQDRTEEILLDAVERSGWCDVRFGVEAVGLDQGRDGVTLRTRARDGGLLEARYLVGCDGAGSFVRKALGLPFEGFTYGLRPMLADIRVGSPQDALPWPRIRNGPDGLTFAVRLKPGLWRLIRLDLEDPVDEAVPDAEVESRAREVLGAPGEDVVWSNRFRIHRRSAPRFRADRVLLAGDAAHLHSPVGAMGMNAGIQDAGNLAWKLARALGGGSPERLLESYDVERRAMVVEQVAAYTDVITRYVIQSPGVARAGIFQLLRTALKAGPLRRKAAGRTMMVDLRCPASPILDPSERAAGRRLPNPLLRGPLGGTARLHDLLPLGPALVEVTGRSRFPSHAHGLPLVRIGPQDHEDPSGALRRLLGGRDGWILVRPDQHIAWARRSWAGMDQAIQRALGDGPEAGGEGDRPEP
jgi:2-polyprenyl-6-methoxyphenol hydroxylase-like FAD-dependent oxidoreductase